MHLRERRRRTWAVAAAVWMRSLNQGVTVRMELTRLAGPPVEGRDPGRRDEGRCHSSDSRRRMNVHSLGEARVFGFLFFFFTIFYFILGYN